MSFESFEEKLKGLFEKGAPDTIWYDEHETFYDAILRIWDEANREA